MLRGPGDGGIAEVSADPPVLVEVAELEDPAQHPVGVVPQMVGLKIHVPEQRCDPAGEIARIVRIVGVGPPLEADLQRGVQGLGEAAQRPDLEAIPAALVAVDGGLARADPYGQLLQGQSFVLAKPPDGRPERGIYGLSISSHL